MEMEMGRARGKGGALGRIEEGRGLWCWLLLG